jgi:outer membrane protein assembly factor BamB
VFLSECYELGGVLVEFNEKFVAKVLWKKPDFNIHWMTPILSDGHLYGVSGRHQQGAEMVCVEVDTGKEVWRNRIAWEQEVQGRKLPLEAFRASLLRADGHYLCLSELGSLLWLDLSPKGWKILSKAQLFFASGTWTLPAVSRGLLYVMQNDTDRMSNTPTRILCYDLRKN